MDNEYYKLKRREYRLADEYVAKEVCICGKVITSGSKNIHLKTKIHLACMKEGVQYDEYMDSKRLGKFYDCPCGKQVLRSYKKRHGMANVHILKMRLQELESM
jgi:hypothetical protein